MDKKLNFDISNTWRLVKNVKRMVEDVLNDYPETIRYSSGMVASELVGNIIKYGDLTERAPKAGFSITVTDTQMLIEVSNGVKTQESLEQVRTRIEKMANSANKAEFYLNRLQELLSDSSKGSQLGLYRIGYEGEFELSCTYTDPVLTIRATRGLS